jgi:hypothetical protein
MKITKRQLKRIIKEEKAKLVREMNPDGTISDDEDIQREEFLAEVGEQIDELIDFVHQSSERIGGGFRSPGIRAQAKELMLAKIQGMRRRQ